MLLVCVNKSSPSQHPCCKLPSFAMQTAFPYDQMQHDTYSQVLVMSQYQILIEARINGSSTHGPGSLQP